MNTDKTTWLDGNRLDEVAFCQEFLRNRKLCFYGGAFFTPEGMMTDEISLRRGIYEVLKTKATTGMSRRVSSILEALKLEAQVDDLPPQQDRIHLKNGTLYLDGTFVPGKEEIVRNRLPIAYDPQAPEPKQWLSFLSQLLYPEDIPTLQEFMGYCLIPSNRAQRMMVIKGKGGEGKSQIGAVLATLLGSNMKDGSIGKVSENAFARADLEHTLLMVDDDMRLEALRQTNYVKSIVTAQGKMDLERKGRQSYQGWLYARLLGFSNGDLLALYDRSNGFYRRQLVLTTRDKSPDRRDDPFLAEKLRKEAGGILLWAIEGLQRLVGNNFRFTESCRALANRESAQRDSNNVYDFLESEGYVRLKADAAISSKELYEIYQMWCLENSVTPLKPKSLSSAIIAAEKRYNLEHTNNIVNAAGRRVRGFYGLESAIPTRTFLSLP